MTGPVAPDCPWRFCLAPMMNRTDRHFRLLCRLIAPRIRLYTEMLTARAVLYGDPDRLLRHHADEAPLALQLAGRDPDELARAARRVAGHGFSEINLNAGCPSSRVREGGFGAAMMAEPGIIGACLAALKDGFRGTVTLKCRLGIDHQQPEESLWRTAEAAVRAGVDAVMVHARKAWLSGLDPAQNREIPPLDYGLVRRLKRDFPDLVIVLNGGLREAGQVLRESRGVDGVMIGRAAFGHPWHLAAMEAALFPGRVQGATGDAGVCLADPVRVLERYRPRALAEIADGEPPRRILRHLVPLVQGWPGARRVRGQIAEAGDLDEACQAFSLLEAFFRRLPA